jgi:hypothetical protein
MENVTLEQVNRNILKLKEELDGIKDLLEERDLELEDDVIEEIKDSRNRSEDELVSHEDMRKEFNDRN